MAASAIDAAIIHDDVARALAEDVGGGDLTATLIPEAAPATATIITREKAVICGQPWVNEVFRQLDRSLQIHWWVREGDRVGAGRTLCTLEGSARHLLTGERTALNFLQTLSATATSTAAYVDAVAGTGTRILDTRKTLPGLRRAQKYAVSCGGGVNHRIGLYDGILIKENHIAAAGSVKTAVTNAREKAPAGVAVEVEVENLEQVTEALESGADILLLDNMTPERLREAFRLNAGRAKLEASGGITLKTIRAVAETGVDYISIGALTKDLRAVDLSMRFTV
ncbi:carboxylating nicotinate-nucleotide diphosphorylase [Thiohalomonas denitrificans]|uniref:Probable nicotinate-nucleotide pyrophosphorylase [carboxylating] n=1 Tax=Thiohalomonas denitrificans TaxID=415747 RepID=A0A1G5PPV3_9GAMM|nr:carboxylating nicotinate-nucleotide diphosphorylase [Thiohalomonas denitrificans]SCZ51584.1 nicotinate-nucleotide pyrophosphorylase [carboxylating] [Thiohalomonas denitrificans]